MCMKKLPEYRVSGKKMCIVKFSFTLLLKIRQPVAVSFHCFYNLHNCVDSQPDEIDQKQGPENIYLEHLEVTADQTQCYGQG